MSKILYLLRHAKSSREDNQLDDFDRPLNPRGLHDAHLIKEAVQKRQIMPDKIYSSPAKRAQQTALIIREKSLYFEASQLELVRELYDNHMDWVKWLSKFVKKLPDFHKEVLIVGHNPMLEETFHYLTGKFVYFSTWTLAAIKFPLDSRKEVGPQSGKKLFVDKPSIFKNYKERALNNL